MDRADRDAGEGREEMPPVRGEAPRGALPARPLPRPRGRVAPAPERRPHPGHRLVRSESQGLVALLQGSGARLGRDGLPPDEQRRRVCAHKKVTPATSLRALHPEIAAQWHPKANAPRTPDDVAARSNKRFTWVCPADPAHTWLATVDARTKPNATGCPF